MLVPHWQVHSTIHDACLLLVVPVTTADGLSNIQALQWRHNERDGVSNLRRVDCLLNRLFVHESKETLKLRVTVLCEGNHRRPVDSPHKGPVTRKMFPFDDVTMIDTKLYDRSWFNRVKICTLLGIPCDLGETHDLYEEVIMARELINPRSAMGFCEISFRTLTYRDRD